MGMWTSPSVFIKHYNLPIIGNDITSTSQKNTGIDLDKVIPPERYIPRLANKKHYVKLAAKIARQRAKKYVKKVNLILANRRKTNNTIPEPSTKVHEPQLRTSEMTAQPPETVVEVADHSNLIPIKETVQPNLQPMQETNSDNESVVDIIGVSPPPSPEPMIEIDLEPEESHNQSTKVNVLHDQSLDLGNMTNAQLNMWAFGNMKDQLQAHHANPTVTTGKVTQYQYASQRCDTTDQWHQQ